jgi:hypothetical protein
MVTAIALGPITAIAPCRIVAVVDEPLRFGFAYGTLPGHPESGEEAFIIDNTDQAVIFQIVASLVLQPPWPALGRQSAVGFNLPRLAATWMDSPVGSALQADS